MFQNNKICQLFNIKYPIIQGGMIWVSGAKLAAACSNAGALGLIGAGSMDPILLKAHIEKTKTLTSKPFGVNIPLLYKHAEEQIKVALDSGVKIFFTSAGSPKKFTKFLQDHGAIVVHVTSTPELALKCQECEVNAVVAEGVEAGGHNGRDEITTMALIPQVAKVLSIPLLAAGGIANGNAVAAAIALGADGVQIGSRFVVTQESSAHPNFKKSIINATATSTALALKKLVPVRLIKNDFFMRVSELEDNNASVEELSLLLGKGRSKKGMFEGDMVEGELEIGQISGLINDLPSAAEVINTIINDYKSCIKRLNTTI